MLVILAAAAVATSGLDWCANEKAADKPRNVEDRNACAAVGVSLYMDRMMSYRDGPQTCEEAAKRLTEEGTLEGPPQVGDGYWVENWDISKPTIRCHIVKIDGKTIEMR
jgi:hypothetical protein